MARTPKHDAIATPSQRKKLASRPEPYSRQIDPGLFLLYRKSRRGSSWIAKQRVGSRYPETFIGTPDDGERVPNGETVLTYAEACGRARSLPLIVPGERRDLSIQPFPRSQGAGPSVHDCVIAYLDWREAVPGGPRQQVMTREARVRTESQWLLHSGSLGSRPVAATSATHLGRWLADLANKPPKRRRSAEPFDSRNPEDLRARQASANRLFTTVKSALMHAWRQGVLPANCRDFWRTVQKFKIGDPPFPQMLDGSEITRLINACAPDLRELVWAALFVGARAGELRRLNVGDFCPETGTIRIRQTKTGKILTQPLTAEGRRFSERHTVGRKAREIILLDRHGEPWSAHSYKRPFNQARRAAGLERIKFKSTRATYGKLLLLATRDIELVAKALGHSDAATTRKHYAQYLPNELAIGIASMAPLGIPDDGVLRRLPTRSI